MLESNCCFVDDLYEPLLEEEGASNKKILLLYHITVKQMEDERRNI